MSKEGNKLIAAQWKEIAKAKQDVRKAQELKDIDQAVYRLGVATKTQEHLLRKYSGVEACYILYRKKPGIIGQTTQQINPAGDSFTERGLNKGNGIILIKESSLVNDRWKFWCDCENLAEAESATNELNLSHPGNKFLALCLITDRKMATWQVDSEDYLDEFKHEERFPVDVEGNENAE